MEVCLRLLAWENQRCVSYSMGCCEEGEGDCDVPGRKEGEREGKQYGLQAGGRVDNSEHVFLMQWGEWIKKNLQPSISVGLVTWRGPEQVDNGLTETNNIVWT